MGTRLSIDLLFLAFIGAVASWFSHAPEDPPARAAYLCGPIIVVGRVATQLENALVDDGNTIAPTPPWRPDPGRVCLRLVIRLSEPPSN